MISFVFRVVVSVTISCTPILIIYLGSNSRDAMIIWFLPFIAVIPATAGALFLFAPIEALLDANALGGWKNLAVPVAGAIIPVIVFAIIGGAFMFEQVLSGSKGHIQGMLFWCSLGLAWGVVWRLSDLAWWGTKRIFKGKE
ncbi:hypothetical protein GCM10007879_02800 [Maritalea porphyrae]|uniref:Uncharacterized protein n=2 Tax=Maritalea porphyrae TaxID=880732 RepID=A0ABQ5UL76_9HYPH|nr:hypothetical protein GCM10007879_02800 [Maritalea porphyrae]